jgi:hypothetical protein
MCRVTITTLLAAALAAAGCDRTDVAGPDHERPAPPNSFVVTTGAGVQLSGSAARIDIRHADAAQPPDVEISFSATGGGGGNWSVLTAAPAEFLQTLNLTARVVDGRVGPGTATVQGAAAGGEVAAASTGLLSLRLYAGRLSGEASRMEDALAARFDGPFIVTCSVPAASLAGAAPAPAADGARPALIVDEAFESAACKPYATLGGWSRSVQR